MCALGLILTWALAELVPATHVRDAVALADLTRFDHPLLEAPAGALLVLLDPLLYALWGAIMVAVALRRRLPQAALAAGLLLVLAPLSAELFKPLLAHAHAHVGFVYVRPASWPSGHATAALTLVWAALLVAPRRARPTVALIGGAYAAAVGCSLLILAWHMPSDVLGGYLLATLWASLALAALQAAEPALPWAPGAHNDSEPSLVRSLALRLRMNSMSDSRFR